MTSWAQRVLFHVRPLLLGLAVAVGQGMGSFIRLPFLLLRTADVHGDAGVLAKIDFLAGISGMGAGEGAAATEPGSPLWVRGDLFPSVDRELTRQLLTHESPLVRALMAQHLASSWPEDARLAYPLLQDNTVAFTSHDSGWFLTTTVSHHMMEEWCHRAAEPAIQELLLRAAGDREVGGGTRDWAIRCVAVHRPDDAMRVALAWQHERGSVIVPSMIRVLKGEHIREYPWQELPPAGSGDSSAPSVGAQTRFRPIAPVFRTWYDYGPYQVAELPVPVRRPQGLRVAVFHIYDPLFKPHASKEEETRERDKVTAPMLVCDGDPVFGRRDHCERIDWTDDSPSSARARFGFSPPADGVVGHFSDSSPWWQERMVELRPRIYADLDVLLPFFAEPSRPWTAEATRAAQEVRDLFPLASEPGLWPYYKAEGKDFFAWLDTHAPPEKAPLPW